MSHSTERVYRESGEEAYDEADKGEPADSHTDEPSGTGRSRPSRLHSGRQVPDQRVG
jgi:hypothetical protein